jgi:MEMO1 family protein
MMVIFASRSTVNPLNQEVRVQKISPLLRIMLASEEVNHYSMALMVPKIPQPRLRPYVAWEADARQPPSFQLVDRLGLAPPMRLTAQEASWLEKMDGLHDQAAANGESDRWARFVRRLDENLLLEGPRFHALVDDPVRPPRCIGCYEGDPDKLRHQLSGLFTDERGPGTPAGLRRATRQRLRAALIPHIDYARGGVTYAWGFKEVVEQTDASLFVIIGTSHYSPNRFTLTRKNFQTPLGVVPTDQDYIDRLVANFGSGLFDDELPAHLPEHSIELEVVFLQYLYEPIRPIRIVPLVVGSFGDCISHRCQPTGQPDIARMIEALRRVDVETSEPICYIISGDLAHIGPKFQDPLLLTAARLRHSKKQDLAILRHAEEVRPAAYYQVIADENDERSICGLSPTFTLLEAVRPKRGQLLHYDQYVDPRGQESVSFASMTFF